MSASKFRGDTIFKVPPFSLVPKRLGVSSLVMPAPSDFPSPFPMKKHFVLSIDSSSAACIRSTKGTYGKLWPVPGNAIQRQREQREQREAHGTDLADGGRELQKIKCTCFIEGVFTSRIRSCLTLLKP